MSDNVIHIYIAPVSCFVLVEGKNIFLPWSLYEINEDGVREKRSWPEIQKLNALFGAGAKRETKVQEKKTTTL
jgi:hypothetical protein